MTEPGPSKPPPNEEELRHKIAGGSQNPDDYRNLADLVIAKGGYEEAISLYQQAVNLRLTNFQKARVSMELGWLLYQTGQQSKALQLARSALELLSQEPETAEVLACKGASQSLLAHVAWFTDEKSGAEAARVGLEWLKQATDEPSDFEGKAIAYVDSARLYILLGDAQEAIKFCERSLQLELNEIDKLSCLAIYGEALWHEKRFPEAEQVLGDAIRYVESHRPGLYKGLLLGLSLQLGLIQRSTNRLEEARTTLQKVLGAVQADPHLRNDSQFLGEIYTNLGAVYYDSEKYDEATAAFKEALVRHSKDDRDHFNALLWLGYCQEAKGDHVNARNSLNQVIVSAHAAEADKTSARRASAELHYETGEYEKAVESFQEILTYHPDDDPDHRNALLWLGYCYQAKGDTQKALDYFKQVLASSHASEVEETSARKGVTWNSGKIHYGSAEYGEAAAAFEETLRYHPDDDPNRPVVLLWLANSYAGNGDHVKAQECFAELLASPNALEEDKISARRDLAWNLGKLHYESEKYEEAAAAFEEVLSYQPEDDPDHWNTLIWLGNCYETMGDHGKAQDCFEKVLASANSLEADKKLARRGVGWNLGKFYFDSRRYDQAAAAFEEALRHYPDEDPNLPSLLEWLGTSYKLAGDYAKARKRYEALLALPQATETEKAMARDVLAHLPPKKTYH